MKMSKKDEKSMAAGHRKMPKAMKRKMAAKFGDVFPKKPKRK